MGGRALRYGAMLFTFFSFFDYTEQRTGMCIDYHDYIYIGGVSFEGRNLTTKDKK